MKTKKFFGVFYRSPFLIQSYHFALAFLGAFLYGFPSRKMTVIGVTGTKGKTTVSNLIASTLASVGHKVGLATTVNFRIGDKEWANDSKQTMLGRFQLQKLLAGMVRAGCRYAIIETSSEGILQYRHRFIDYRIVVFINLSAEHIERHGSFENYRAAKIKLFEKAARRKDGIGVFNLDDENIEYFLKPKIKNKYGYALQKNKQGAEKKWGNIKVFEISNIKASTTGTSFDFNGQKLEINLLGSFNVENAAAAACVALSQGLSLVEIKKALKETKPIPGRIEIVDTKRDFKVIIDYAHEPLSLVSLYQSVKEIFRPRKMICLLGGQGGGRDKWKRKEMGKIASGYCDSVILTNEDPYDENPISILEDIESGIGLNQYSHRRPVVYKIIDREEAIKKVVSLARKGDAVILSGKGGEVWMCVAGGRKIPWKEKEVVLSALKSLTVLN